MNNSSRTRYLLTLLISLSIFSANSISQTPGRGLSFAENFENLPYFKKGIQTYQFSSTDPAEDQFNDYFHWLYTDTDSTAVLADIKGPGTIYRIWSTGNSGDTNRLKIYIDGESKPRIDETFNSFHNHPPLRDKPQVGTGGNNYLAWWSYMPISFKKSIRIAREGNLRPFYNITYHSYTDTAGVESWKGNEKYSKLEHMWSSPEKDPKSARGNITVKNQKNILPGDSVTIFTYEGSGYIASLKVSNYLPHKNFRIKMYWDGQTAPAVDAPVKWFFGSVDNGGDLRGLGVGTVNGNGYCYFPMPFWKKAKIVLINNTDAATGTIDFEVQYNKTPYPEKECGYFHAKANEADKPGKKYTCLKTTGRGHVIGMAKRMPAGGHACEGDEVFYIDNRRFPDIYGTGEEDYANCAWWKNLYNSYPTHGQVGNDCYYRLHYPDFIIYEEALDMEFESWQNYYIASLVWYYEKTKPSLRKTDSIDVGNTESEKLHKYSISGETWAGQKSGNYPGLRIYDAVITDQGKSFSKSNEFTVATNSKNTGMRIRVRTDNKNFQGVRVWVDGRLVVERPWMISKNRYNAIWVDSDFEIPAHYTKGKSTVTIKLERLKDYHEWTAYRYDIYSYH
jgi:hypothetical protein